MSASRIPTLQPIFFRAKAKFVANVDFPTPPFALDMAIVNFVPGMGFFLKVLPLILLLIVVFLSSIKSTYLVFSHKDTI